MPQLVSLYGADAVFYTPDEAAYCRMYGDMPDSYYERNKDADPELLGGPIASIIEGVAKAVFSGGISIAQMVHERRAQRRQFAQDQTMSASQQQADIAATQIQAKAKETSMIVPVAIGGAALIAVVLLLKK